MLLQIALVVSARFRRLRYRQRRGNLDSELVKDLGKGKYCWFEGSKSMKKKLRRGLRYPSIVYPKRVVND